MTRPLVVAITGCSGVPYGRRLLHVLCELEREVHLTISTAGADVIQQELGVELDLAAPDLERFVGRRCPTIRYFHHSDFHAPMASGSALNDGMVICPCSGSTMGAVAAGTGSNVIHRAAQVQLKEHRKLILVPRETPLSVPLLEAMLKCAQAGAVLLPAAPGYYHRPRTIDDLVDFVVARILDHLEVPHQLAGRWGTEICPT